MSRRQRQVRERSLRQRVARNKALRRRARLAGARPAAVVATTAALAVAGVGVPSSPAVSAASDRATCGSPRTPGSYPSGLVDVAGTVFLAASDGVHGEELWKSDGSRAGTVMVKDINRGGTDRDYSYGPRQLTKVGASVFFSGNDGAHGEELWKSDGTRAGTVMVRNISPDDARSPRGPSSLTDVDGTLMFVAGPRRARALWTSDGTRAGTVRVKDIEPLEGDYSGALTAVGDEVFFAADDGTGLALWKSDGTEAGTVEVKDVAPMVEDYGAVPPLGLGDTLYFVADDGTHGAELWSSDGTEDGTVMVKDIRPGTYDSDVYDLTAVGNTLFFSARDGTHGQELWRSDGSGDGTEMVKDISADSRRRGPSSLTAVGDTLFFAVPDNGGGTSLWSSDGSSDGTTLVKSFGPPSGNYSQGVSYLTNVAGTLFFAADDGSHGQEVWTSDGSETGTVMVKDIGEQNDDAYSYGPGDFTAVGSRLFFTADDGVHGEEVWRSNGTEAGTVLVSDIDKGGAFFVPRRADANLRLGTLTLKVRTAGAGKLVVGAPRGDLLKEATYHPRKAGRTEVTLRPDAAGQRRLERALREAHRQGRQVGKVGVRARFTFTPCGGTASSQVHRFTLMIR